MPCPWVPREGGLGGSDPGPRWTEPEPDAPSEDDGSYATENSDEEPLVGEPAAHVEAMLSNCLDPDERQCFGEDEDEDEDEKAAEAAGTAEDEDEEGEGAAVDSSSEHEESEEGARLEFNVEVINAGMRDFGELSELVLHEASELPQPLEPLTGAELAAAVSTLPARLRELRELQQQLRMLAFNQQALLADSAQQLLYLAKAQATLAMRRHEDHTHRHQQLRIVRRESARLCRCLDALHTELRQQSDLAAQPPPRALQAEHGDAPRRSRGGSRRRAERAERAERRGARGEPHAAPQPPPSPEAQHAPRAPSSPPPGRRRSPERIKLRDDEIAGGGGGGGGGGGAAAVFGGSRAPAELVQLVGLACSRASAELAGGGAGGGGLPEGAKARRKVRPATAAAVAAAAAAPAPGLPADHVLYPGLPADLVAAYAPPPPRPSTASRRRDEGAEAGGGTPRAGSPTNHKAMAAQLRQPALQAALASALWQVLHEHNGQQLLATPVPK